MDGWIPFKDRKIRIRQLGLEEDSCREVSDQGHLRVYLTDRLGMPLIEPVTYPDMKTPQETAEVAEIIRKLLRSTGRVRTGHGAGRQDVNVSVRGGTRIEIKGVSSIAMIPKLVYNEAMRQCSLLSIRDLLAERGVTSDSFCWSSRDVTSLVSRTPYAPILAALEQLQHDRPGRLQATDQLDHRRDFRVVRGSGHVVGQESLGQGHVAGARQVRVDDPRQLHPLAGVPGDPLAALQQQPGDAGTDRAASQQTDFDLFHSFYLCPSA